MPGLSTAVPAKSDLRSAALAARDALAPDARMAAAAALAGRPFPIPVRPGAVVSGFTPIRSEIDPLPLMRALVAQGAALALPVVAGRDLALVFRAWNFAAPLIEGAWGIREPLPDAPAVDPDILLVPLAAFDRQGHRIGYGAGHYDRTLAALRALKPVVAVGLAFSAQEVAKVPAGDHDERLDLVLTEREVVFCSGA